MLFDTCLIPLGACLVAVAAATNQGCRVATQNAIASRRRRLRARLKHKKAFLFLLIWRRDEALANLPKKLRRL